MNSLPVSETEPKRSTVRPWLIVTFIGFAALILFLFWPRDSALNAMELSRADGKSRFWATAYSNGELPANIPLKRRLIYYWADYKRRHTKMKSAAYSFPGHPVQLCSLQGLLDQCMEVTGTKYFIAVEAVGGSVYFGDTNTLNGAQWVAAFEHAIEKSNIYCYDYAKKDNFEDTLVLIRGKPGVVKIVPRSKLADYKKLGLIKSQSP